MQGSTQRVNKTDWFFLVESLNKCSDADARRHLKWE